MPPKKDSNWSHEKELELCRLVKERPVLYDISSQLYRRTDLKDREWEKVAKELGPTFTCKY